jgi:hypothetical protein
MQYETKEIARQVVILRDNEDLDLTWEQISDEVNRSERNCRAYYAAAKASGEFAEQEQVTVRELSQNEMVVTSKSTAIKRLPQLIEACEIDTDVWVAMKPLYNAWTTPAKNKTNDGWMQIQNYQVKCRFVRREPEAIFPTVQPIRSSVTFGYPKRDVTSGVKRCLVINDLHVGFLKRSRDAMLTPFHDRRAIDIIFQVLQEQTFDVIVLNGDLLDGTEWTNHFRKTPEFRGTTQPALQEMHWILAKIRMLQPEAEIIFLEGNHESRLMRLILDNFEAAYEITAIGDVFPSMSIPHLLDLESLGIRWIGGYDDGKSTYWLTDGFRIRHGNTARVPGNTAKAVVKDACVSEVNGHVHRDEKTPKTLHYRDSTVTVYSYTIGCLCHLDDRVPGNNGERQWRQSFGEIQYTDEREQVFCIHIDYDSATAIYDGKMMVGESYVDALRNDMPEWNWGG